MDHKSYLIQSSTMCKKKQTQNPKNFFERWLSSLLKTSREAEPTYSLPLLASSDARFLPQYINSSHPRASWHVPKIFQTGYNIASAKELPTICTQRGRLGSHKIHAREFSRPLGFNQSCRHSHNVSISSQPCTTSSSVAAKSSGKQALQRSHCSPPPNCSPQWVVPLMFSRSFDNHCRDELCTCQHLDNFWHLLRGFQFEWLEDMMWVVLKNAQPGTILAAVVTIWRHPNCFM